MIRFGRNVALLVAAMLAGPAAATEYCDDFWFTRNLIMDRAGYCFGSPLGEAVFDNSDCTGQEITLSAQQKRFVATIREKEKTCINRSDRTALDLPDLEIRRQLNDLPLRDEFASGCLGWRGARQPLRAGHSEAAPIIGWIEPGDYILYQHVGVGDWGYVTTHGPDWSPLKAGGWSNHSETEESCDLTAG